LGKKLARSLKIVNQNYWFTKAEPSAMRRDNFGLRDEPKRGFGLRSDTKLL
jgi:hypothetical protein